MSGERNREEMIESSSNSHIKKIQKLMKNARFRRQEQAFVVEGWKMVSEALERRLVKAVYLSDCAYQEYRERLAARELSVCEKDVAVETVSDQCFRLIADTVTPQGILAIVHMPEYDKNRILSLPDSALLCLEDIQDPGNLGTMMRTAEGAGMSALVLSKGCVDIFNPKVVRSTMGALFRVPFFVCEDMSTEVELLKREGFVTYAAHLGAEQNFMEEKYARKTAVLIGNEAKGLSDGVSEKADRLLKIPMEGELESLNAAVSAALFMYEVYRRRKNVLQ